MIPVSYTHLDVYKRQHTINLRTLNPAITVEELEQVLYWAFARAYGAQPAWLDERILDGRSIAALTLRFSDPKWIYPEAMASTFSVSERFPWGQAVSYTHLHHKPPPVCRYCNRGETGFQEAGCRRMASRVQTVSRKRASCSTTNNVGA